jgi:PRTRC genetic system protein C
MLKVETLSRVFIFNGIRLEDINSNLSESTILNHYSGIYPELTNATIENKGIQNNKEIVYEFKSTIGTKG